MSIINGYGETKVIEGSPFAVTVNPALPSHLKDTSEVSCLVHSISSSNSLNIFLTPPPSQITTTWPVKLTGELLTVSIHARDAFGNDYPDTDFKYSIVVYMEVGTVSNLFISSVSTMVVPTLIL